MTKIKPGDLVWIEREGPRERATGSDTFQNSETVVGRVYGAADFVRHPKGRGSDSHRR